MAAYDVITKANLQYYDGKLKREIAKKGDVKEIRFHGASTEIDDSRYEAEQGVYVFKPDIGDLIKRSQGNDGAAWGYTYTAITDSSGDTRDRDSITINYERHPNPNINKYHVIFGRHSINDDTAYVYNNQNYRIPLKDDVDATFLAASGHKFKEISTTQFPTIETFLDIWSANWDATGEGYMSASDRREDTIYLYPYTENGARYFDEYLYYPGEPPAGPNDSGVPAFFEFLGTLKQDLTGYVKEADIPETDNDYIDGLFLRNLEPGIYNASGRMVKSWAQLTDGSRSSPVFVADATTFYGYNSSLYADQISDAGVTLIFPSNIITFNGSAPSSNTPTNIFLKDLEFLQTVLFKGQMSGLDGYRIFDGCTSLQKVYSVNDLPDSEKGVTSAKFIVI